LNAAADEKSRIFLDQICLELVAGREVEVPLLHQAVADSSDDGVVICVGDFRDQKSDGEGFSTLKRSGQKAWSVVELASRRFYSFARFLRDGSPGNVV